MDRRSFLKRAGCAAAGSWAAARARAATLELQGVAGMNVLFIDIEDCAIAGLGCYGNPIPKTPNLDRMFSQAPVFLELKAHGKAVGLPSDGDMGNSEVGHNALGAGRVFSQGAKLVSEAIHSGKLFKGRAWEEVQKRTHQGGTLHFIGMVSDGNVHSHIDQLDALLDQGS